MGWPRLHGLRAHSLHVTHIHSYNNLVVHLLPCLQCILVVHACDSIQSVPFPSHPIPINCFVAQRPLLTLIVANCQLIGLADHPGWCPVDLPSQLIDNCDN
jgi:hypothetical protein